MSKTYSTLSNARRAAKAAGLDLATLAFFAVAGGFVWVTRTSAVLRDEPVLLPALPTKTADEATSDLSNALAPVVSAKTPTHKEFSLYTRSAVISPVQFVHKFLDEQGAKLSRKEALYELAKAGVNYATARTQYQRWFANRAK